VRRGGGAEGVVEGGGMGELGGEEWARRRGGTGGTGKEYEWGKEGKLRRNDLYCVLSGRGNARASEAVVGHPIEYKDDENEAP